MKAKFGLVVVAGSGKLGGHVFTSNKAGASIRTKVTPINRKSTGQNAVRNLFTSLAQAWRGLTQAQRDAWNAAVANFQRTNVFGDLRSVSGIALFQRLNNVLLQAGGAMIVTPPLPVEVANIVVESVTAAVAVPALSIVLNDDIPAGTGLQIWATAPQSAGVDAVNSKYRQIGFGEALDTSPINALAMYTAKFGNTGAIGQKIFVKVVPFSTVSGQIGSPTTASVITTA